MPKIDNQFNWQSDQSYLKAPRGAKLSEDFFEVLLKLHANRVKREEGRYVIGPLREEIIAVGDHFMAEFLIASTDDKSKCTQVKCEIALTNSQSIIDATRTHWPDRAFAVRVLFMARRGLISPVEVISSDWYDYFGMSYTEVNLVLDDAEVYLTSLDIEDYKNDALLEIEKKQAKKVSKKNEDDDAAKTLEDMIAQAKDPKQRKLLEGMRKQAQD